VRAQDVGGVFRVEAGRGSRWANEANQYLSHHAKELQVGDVFSKIVHYATARNQAGLKRSGRRLLQSSDSIRHSADGGSEEQFTEDEVRNRPPGCRRRQRRCSHHDI
jgi:hypothetical protein